MTSRLLPRGEWTAEKIGHLPIWAHLATCDRDRIEIVVVEQDGRVIAACGLIQVLMAHGLYVDPAYRARRGCAAMWRLWAAMQREARALGAAVLETQESPAIVPLLKFVKARDGGRAWAIPLKG